MNDAPIAVPITRRDPLPSRTSAWRTYVPASDAKRSLPLGEDVGDAGQVKAFPFFHPLNPLSSSFWTTDAAFYRKDW
jgi:hypothetical protein